MIKTALTLRFGSEGKADMILYVEAKTHAQIDYLIDILKQNYLMPPVEAFERIEQNADTTT